MNIFQVYDKPAPPRAPYLGYMRAAQAMADTYTLIAPANFMGGHFVPYAEALAAVPAYLRENTNGPFYLFDALRARYLALHFDCLYLDLDVELLSPIPMRDQPQTAGPGLMAGNGRAEDGAAAWENYIRLCPLFCRPATLMFSQVPHYEIPETCYIHHHAAGDY